MSNRDKILNLLHNNINDYISGELISTELGISRTAVWKNINTLKEMGYRIDSSSKLGHKLISQNDIFNVPEIKRNLKTDLIGQGKIEFFEQTDSTNIQAFKLADLGAEEGTLVIAESQTMGKGRLSRKWFDDPGNGICLSIILKPKIQPIMAPRLTLVTAVSLAETLDELGLDNYYIKWPNDILIDGRKVAGILSEMKANIDFVEFIIIGCGININSNISTMPDEIKDIACSLSEVLGHSISRSEFLQDFLKKFEDNYNDFMRDKFPEILEKWIEKSKILNRKIKVSILDKELIGTVKKVNSDGNLVVETDMGEKVINAGDINYID